AVPGRDEPWDTGAEDGPRRLREYRVQVVILAPGNRDTITHLPDYLDWRQRIARAFGAPVPFAGGIELWRTDIDPDVPLDRRGGPKLYDYSAIEIRYRCIEPAS